MESQGLIIKSSGGFYYVKTPSGEVVECRARGAFRKIGTSPLVGDYAHITPADNGKGFVSLIEDRRNSFVRPPVANVDKLVIVVSTVSPSPNTVIIDRLTAYAVNKDVEPVIVFTKCDLKRADELLEIYEKTKIRCFCSDLSSDNAELAAYLSDSCSVFTGNSGAGKSTLLNSIAPNLRLDTGEISEKLGRGRHTTRTTEMFELQAKSGTIRVIDTPGFSSLDIEGDMIEAPDLQYCFPEFEGLIEKCRFGSSCAHVCEKGCAVCEAVESGEVSRSRHDSYVYLYNEVKDIKPWTKKK